MYLVSHGFTKIADSGHVKVRYVGTRQEEEEALYRIVIPGAFLENVNDFWGFRVRG